MNAPQSYPLQWPMGWPRTPMHKRRKSSFQSHGKPLTTHDALQRLQQQIDLLHGRYAVVSTNVETRLDGLPRSGINPNDPGAALYFQLKGRSTTMPCDAFTTVADNIAAIAAHIDAVRRIERYGVGTLEQMFTGFQAIRGPGERPWREVLGFRADDTVTRAMIISKRSTLAMQHHPDRPGGDAARMAEINDAVDRALQGTSA